jgi:hypothetical protein
MPGRPNSDVPQHQLHTLFTLLTEKGWAGTPGELVARFERLAAGISAEDEFAVILAWLGRVVTVHKLDQLQLPAGAKARFLIPDLLAVFEQGDSRMAALIEVKSSVQLDLNWRADYYEPVMSYAAELNLPLLIAWKMKRLGLWTLCDARVFRKAIKNYHLKYNDALKHNLLGILAADTAVVPYAGVAFNLLLRKEALIDRKESDTGRTETWQLVVEDAYFTNGSGDRVDAEYPDLFPLFLCFPSEPLTESSETHLLHKFVIPEEGAMRWAHQALTSLLEFQQPGGSQIPWRKLVMSAELPLPYARWLAAAQRGFTHNVVRYVLHQRPEAVPDFLEGTAFLRSAGPLSVDHILHEQNRNS